MEHNYRIASNVFFFCPSLFLSFYKRCNKQTAPRDGCRPRKWDIIINRRGGHLRPRLAEVCPGFNSRMRRECICIYYIPRRNIFLVLSRWHHRTVLPFVPLFSLFVSISYFKKHKGNVFINTGHFAAAVRDESCFRWRERVIYVRTSDGLVSD